jgi:hypothetical protein
MLPRPGECRDWNPFRPGTAGGSLLATLIYNIFAATVQTNTIDHSDINRRL